MISILGNLGNAGFALPMTQAYPTDVNTSAYLVWNPTTQSLDYTTELDVLGDASIAGTLYTNSIEQLPAAATLGLGADLGRLILSRTGDSTLLGGLAARGPFSTARYSVQPSDSPISSYLAYDGLYTGTTYALTNRVVSQRQVGWTAATGTATRTTFLTSTVTLPQLAERVKALIDDLTSHGLIGT